MCIYAHDKSGRKGTKKFWNMQMIGENSSDFLNFVSKSRGFEYQQEKNRTFRIKKLREYLHMSEKSSTFAPSLPMVGNLQRFRTLDQLISVH